ncbi:MAG: sigma-70 family RNA polymerase sigma factor [Planctomycetia bacterium]|nr:sigma-70 family RNA polymerase sigma factor [Planctomycetia bacterium]
MSDSSEKLTNWLNHARAGEEAALGEALEACRAYLLHVAERELDAGLRAKGGASDLVQQTFLEAQQDFSRFSGTTEAELLAWLRRMLLNNVANFRRQWVHTAKRSTQREVSIHPADSFAQERSWLDDGSSSPSKQMMAGEQEEALYAAMERLPEDYAQVLRLRYIEGLSFDDVGLKMNRTANAVRKLWARAIEKLQEEMELPP